nr:shikimate kinase [Rhabdothermincola salaria]
MGVGKSTVGRRVAQELGRPFSDSDAVIEERTGRTVAQIFAHEGEPAFRTLETEVLAEVLDDPTPTVVAAAGGVVLDPANRTALARAGTVVWLQAPLELLVERVAGSTHRPALEDDPAGTLARLAEGREGLYAEVSDLLVDAARPLDEVVDLIVTTVREREASSAAGGPTS